jgi:hypothetical protein
MHGETRNLYKVLVGKPEGKRLIWRPGVVGRIILKLILRKYDEVRGLSGFSWFMIVSSGRLMWT